VRPFLRPKLVRRPWRLGRRAAKPTPKAWFLRFGNGFDLHRSSVIGPACLHEWLSHRLPKSRKRTSRRLRFGRNRGRQKTERHTTQDAFPKHACHSSNEGLRNLGSVSNTNPKRERGTCDQIGAGYLAYTSGWYRQSTVFRQSLSSKGAEVSQNPGIASREIGPRTTRCVRRR
jgi:hypothetical protein